MNDSEGELAVRIARQVVETETNDDDPGKVDLPESFREERGVFVTIKKFPSRDLRGCIGYPEPIYSLGRALIKAAQGACNDPRFPSLEADEVEDIVIEVSILTPPQEIECEDRSLLPQMITVGEDGLIVERGPFKGLLLPQVPIEWDWDAETFLSQTCSKAGATPDCWMDEETKVSRFQAEVFAEQEPEGEVRRRQSM